MGRLLKGEYCRACTAKFKAEGYVWSDYYQNWIKPEDKATEPEPVERAEFQLKLLEVK